jgi:hypothetical protein
VVGHAIEAGVCSAAVQYHARKLKLERAPSGVLIDCDYADGHIAPLIGVELV